MSLRDLGYKPYLGHRRPASANLWIVARQGLRRAIAPFAVKASLVLACFAVCIYPLVYLAASAATVTTASGTRSLGSSMSAAGFVRGMFDWQLWLFVFVITIAAGSGAVAHDVQNRAFQYYFSKPVTRAQYLFGRVAPVAFLVFLVTFVPAVCAILLAAAVAPDRAEAFVRVGLLFPTLLYSVLIGVVTGSLSVAASSLARKRGLTMSLWATVFFLPHVIAVVVRLVTDWNGLYLASVPGALGVLGDALFKRAIEGPVGAASAGVALLLLCTASLYGALRRLENVETVGG